MITEYIMLHVESSRIYAAMTSKLMTKIRDNNNNLKGQRLIKMPSIEICCPTRVEYTRVSSAGSTKSIIDIRELIRKARFPGRL